MAFELEINRKCKSRITAKVRRYLSNNYYNYILYLFCSESMCTAYKKIILDEFGEDVLSRVMYFYNSTLLSSRPDDIDSNQDYENVLPFNHYKDGTNK